MTHQPSQQPLNFSDNSTTNVVYTYKHCEHPAEEPILIGGYPVYFGARRDIAEKVINEMDIIVPLNDEMPYGSIGSLLTIFVLPLRDMGGVPKNWEEYINWLVGQIKAGKKILGYCTGGHGRTGTFGASLVAAMEPDVEDPIEEFRKRHCEKAVESLEQAEAIFAIAKKPLPEKYKDEFKPKYTYYSTSTPTKWRPYEVQKDGYRCKMCPGPGKIHKTWNDFLDHLNKCSLPTLKFCHICGDVLYSVDTVDDPKIGTVCKECDQLRKDHKELADYRLPLTYTNDKKWKCTLCNQEFTSYSEVEKHLWEEHLDETEYCSYCNNTVLRSKGGYDTDGGFICLHCQTYEKDKTDKEAKEKAKTAPKVIAAPVPTADNTADKPADTAPPRSQAPSLYECPYCDEEFDSAEEFFDHMTTCGYDGEMSVCPYCGEMLSTDEEADQHALVCPARQ